MAPPANLDGLSHAELKNLVVTLFEQVTEQQRMIAALRDEIARLKSRLIEQAEGERARGVAFHDGGASRSNQRV